MPGKILPFPSRRPLAERSEGRRQQPAPARHVVEVVGLDLAVGEDEDALFHRWLRVARSTFVSGNRADRAGQFVRQPLLGPSLLAPPVREFRHAPHSTRPFPKWLYETLPLWQYANMAIVQIGYIRRVANDTDAPNRIRELRDALGISQAELARRANVTPSALNKVELGTRGLDQDWMRRLAPHLGVAPADLLPEEDNPFGLSPEERDLINRLRSANKSTRQTFDRVAAAMLPDEDKASGAAA